MARIARSILAAAVAVASGVVLSVAPAPDAEAATSRIGTPQITLNPGGGALADGTDGLRFTINNDTNGGQQGQDGLFYRGTQQYCCSAGAPMLNIGGSLYGQSGPASSSGGLAWTSLTIVSTGGQTSTGTRTASTGNSSAVVRYVATKGALEYVLDRTVTYTYPNDFVTDAYTFTIPEGNAEAVKFYLGGDTAPGGSDSGYGVMLTSPVRSVISLNTSSRIQYGLREVSGSKVFDGATSQHYSTPFATVRAGGDIGFVVTAATHDAGLMMQWNLGSTPGVQSASLQQFVNKQGTNLTAGFDRTNTTPGVPVDLDISVDNTDLSAVSPIGFTIALPDNTVVAAGAQANNCGGTLTAAEGGTSVELSGGSVNATANCVISVPVVAQSFGTYTMSSANVTSVVNVTNNVGTSSFFVPKAPEWTQTAIGDLTVGVAPDTGLSTDAAPAATYAVTEGALPAGLTLNVETGAITGTPTTAGPYSFAVTASNSGGSAAQTFSGAVNQGTFTPGISTDRDSAPYGTPVTLNATGVPAGATGTLTFSSGPVELCSATLPGTACQTATDLTPGDYLVAVEYSGDANWLSSDNPVATSFRIDKAAATVSAAPSSPTGTFGTPVAITGEVSPAGATGTVRILSGAVELCSFVLPATGCDTAADLPAGEYPLTAIYSGDDLRTGSDAAAGSLLIERAAVTVVPVDTTTTYGTAAGLMLPGLPADATGTVTFSSNGTVLCSYEVPGTRAACSAPATLAAGTYPVVAGYSGDANHLPTESALTLTVSQQSVSPSVPLAFGTSAGDPTRFTLSGIPADATGVVTVRSGSNVLCTITLPANSCDLGGTLAAGSYTLLVQYPGDGNFGSFSTTTTLEVAAAAVAAPVESPEPATVPVAPALSQTGVNALDWTVAGMLLLLVGGGLLLTSRRPRQDAV